MLSAVSTLVVADLDKGSLRPVKGVSESQSIKPFTLLIEKTPKRWKSFASKQYMVHNFLIADVLSGNSDDIQNIDVTSSKILAYEKERELTVGVGGKVSLEIFKAFPHLKAEANATGGVSIKVKTGGLTIRTVDEKAFEKAMRERTVEKDHALIKALFSKSRRRFCVVSKVLETSQETVIECTSKHDGHAGFTAEVGTQGGAFNADIKSSKIGTLTLDAGTVLAFKWLRIDVDKTTCKVDLDYGKIDVYKLPLQMAGTPSYLLETAEEVNEAGEEVNEADEEVNYTDEDSNKSDDHVNDADEKVDESDEEINDDESDDESDESTTDDEESDADEKVSQAYLDLYNMFIATEDDIKKLKTAVCLVMKSSSDIEALLDLFEDDGGEVDTFSRQLQNSDAVWSLLELIGYKLQDNHIELTYHGLLHHLIPSLIAAMSLFDTEDLEFIRKCDSYQRKEILRIITADVHGKKCIPLDPKFTQELQKEPVENVMALMNYEIDFMKGELSPRPKRSRTFEPVMYLLNCL